MTCDCWSTRSRSEARAIAGSNRSARWVRRCRNREELVEIILQRQVRSLAAHIRYRCNDMHGQLSLNSQIPLLHVRPDGLEGNCSHTEWKERRSSPRTDRVIPRQVKLRGG